MCLHILYNKVKLNHCLFTRSEMQSIRVGLCLVTRKNIKIIPMQIRLMSTVDEKDVLHHTNLLKCWWETDGAIKALHSLNYLRVPYVRDGLIGDEPKTKYSNCLKDFKILDIGCGGGVNSEGLAKFGAQVTGIDASKELIGLAKEHSLTNKQLHNKPTYLCTTVEDHANEFSDYYDAVVASEVLEHVRNEEKAIFLESCARTTKPGGKLFFTTPTRSRMTQILGIYFAEFFNIIPKGTHQYEKFMTPRELQYHLEINDCKVESVAGMAYHFWTNKWEWIDTQKLHFSMQAVKFKKV